MTIPDDHLKPLLNHKTFALVVEHVEILEEMGGSTDDKLVAVGLRLLLLNHVNRAKLLEKKAP